MQRRTFLGAGLALLLAACSAEEPPLYRARLLAMATWVDVALAGTDEHTAENAIASVESFLRRAEQDLYAWAPEGELARLNAALARGEPATVSPELAGLLQRARDLSLASGGLFDPGVGALVELWGFHSALNPPSAPPSDEAIATLLANHASIAGLDIDGLTVTSSAPAPLLDLGGIAKGYVVDHIIEMLAREGIGNVLINAGGDLRVAGTHGGRPWRVGIKDPRHPGVLVALDLAAGEAAFTSGDYERFFQRDGERWHHLLDPTTGRPAMHTAAITVIGTEGVAADAAATALFVAGPERWREVAAALGLSYVLRVDSSGAVQMTPQMQARLHTAGDAASDIIAANASR